MDIEIKFFSKKIQISVFHLLPSQMRLCSGCEMHSLCTFKSRWKKFSLGPRNLLFIVSVAKY